jgi:hypothetical protein
MQMATWKVLCLLVFVLLWAVAKPLCAASQSGDDSAFVRDDFNALVQSVVRMRQAEGASWEDTVAGIDIGDMQSAAQYVANHPEYQGSWLYFLELLWQYEVVHADSVGAILSDAENIHAVKIRYDLFKQSVKTAQQGHPEVLGDGVYSEGLIIRNLILYGTCSTEEKLRVVGDLILCKQELVDVTGLIWYISFVSPEFARSLGSYVYSHNPGFEPLSPYATHFSLIVALAIADGCEVDIPSVKDRIDFTDMEVILNKQQYEEVCSIIEAE